MEQEEKQGIYHIALLKIAAMPCLLCFLGKDVENCDCASCIARDALKEVK